LVMINLYVFGIPIILSLLLSHCVQFGIEL
jgi:hypothetical protein